MLRCAMEVNHPLNAAFYVFPHTREILFRILDFFGIERELRLRQIKLSLQAINILHLGRIEGST
jgi:hypothetical protein